MFTRSGFELFKKKALQQVEERLEQVGIHNSYVQSRTNKFPDERLSDLLDLVEGLTKALEKLIENASVFHKGVCILSESSKATRSLVDDFSKDEQSRYEASIMDGAFDEGKLRCELQDHVTKPARNRLRQLADMKNRIKEVDILRLEAAARRDLVETQRAKAKQDTTRLARYEDQFAEKQVEYEQSLLRLVDDFAVLKRDHEVIFQSAVNSLKVCQYRFLSNSTASFNSICSAEDIERLPSPTASLSSPKSALAKEVSGVDDQTAITSVTDEATSSTSASPDVDVTTKGSKESSDPVPAPLEEELKKEQDVKSEADVEITQGKDADASAEGSEATTIQKTANDQITEESNSTLEQQSNEVEL